MGEILIYLLQVVPFTGFVALIYWNVRGWLLRGKGLRRGAWPQEILLLLLVCYFTGLLSLVLVPPNFWSEFWFRLANGFPSGEMGWAITLDFNFTPSLLLHLRGELTGGSWTRVMAVGNVLMCFPMGILLPWVWKKAGFGKVLAAGGTMSLATELVQPFVGRSFDVDDLIANILGVLLGLTVFLFVRRFLRGRKG